MDIKLERNATDPTLTVNGMPYVVLGGETHNSTGSSARDLAVAMDRAVELGMNTVISAVTWELVEPEEGVWDFSTVDDALTLARERGLRLGLLWFGSWKNAQCSYVPEWVKLDMERFRRAELEAGVRKVGLDFHGFTMPYSTMSAFCAETRDLDARAWAQVMRHVREVDGEQGTILFVQVENEVGLMGAAREHSVEADDAYAQNVPAELVTFMREHEDTLADDVREALAAGAGAGSWEAVFGPVAEELFTSWHTARYVEAVAAAGKAEYALPVAVNCWLDKGKKPGDFPTGGPVARSMEVWAVAAPSVDMVAPDIYVPDFCEVCDAYRKLGNPLIIEETAIHGRVASRALWAVGHHHAVCFAPFAYEDMGEPFDDTAGILFGATKDPAASIPQDPAEYGQAMRALQQLVEVALAQDGSLASMDAVISERPEVDSLRIGTDGSCGVRVRYADGAAGACVVLATGPTEALLLGMRCSIDFVSCDGTRPHLDILAMEDGKLVPDAGGQLVWQRNRRLNGDEATMISCGAPTLLRVKLASFA